MSFQPNPALEAFLLQMGDACIFGQLCIRREYAGFSLRHVADQHLSAEDLRTLCPGDLRQVAQFTEDGLYRPLKSAPNLPTGWEVRIMDDSALEECLNTLYPGSLPDWFAARSAAPPITDFRRLTGRQTGIYRMTQLLTDAQAEEAVRAGCHPKFCLKQRLWTVGTLPPDAPEDKSSIPCLEPCALLLEFSRKALRLAQEEACPAALGPSDLAALDAALESALSQRPRKVREADFDHPANPRRIQLVREKLPLTKRPQNQRTSEEQLCPQT